MKKFVVVFLFICSVTCAQVLVIKEPCADHKEGSPNREAAHSYFHEESNTLYLTYMGKTKLQLNTYVDMQKISEYTFDRTEDAGLFNQVLDVVLKDKKEYYLFFSNPTCGYFSVQVIGLLDKKIKILPEALAMKKDEFYLYSFSDNGHFFIVTSVKKTSDLRIYKYNYSTNIFDPYEVNLNSITFANSTKVIKLWDIIADDNSVSWSNPNLFKFSKDATLKSIIDPKVVSKAIKFYRRNGYLKLTVDGYNNKTYLIDINLSDYSFKYDEIEFDKIGALSNETKKNSYVFEDFLLQVKVSYDKMLVSVVDLKTKQKIQSYSCQATDSTIYFSNTSVIRVTSEKTLFGKEESEKELNYRKIKKTLRIFSDHNIFISAIRNENDNIEMMIGSYYVEMRSTGGMMGGVGGMYGGGSSIPVEMLYFFKSLTSSDFSRKISGYLEDSFYEVLLEKKKKLKCPTKAQTVFKVNDEYYLGYFYSKSSYANEEEYEDKEIKDYYYVEKIGTKQ